ncbi:MAG: hypothetical protein LQ352_002273 [Teloschistes flavicans]|nr:MAG: hypothetical protein LQ352_002273 [Teloschistes flavicans]
MTPTEFEAPHIVLPTIRHTHTIIALHGRGSQGPEFAEELFEKETSSGYTLQQAFPSTKWVFPSYQERYSTVFQEELDEWFDIYSLTDPAAREELQIEGLHDSVDFLRKVVSDEARIVGNDRVILMGLSQGCATALMTLLASGMNVAGFVGLNGWLPYRTQIGGSTSKGALAQFFKGQLNLEVSELAPVLDTPCLLAHNLDDEAIDIDLGRLARDTLERLGMPVVWREEKEGGHLGMLNTSGLDIIAEFLRKQGLLN